MDRLAIETAEIIKWCSSLFFVANQQNASNICGVVDDIHVKNKFQRNKRCVYISCVVVVYRENGIAFDFVFEIESIVNFHRTGFWFW